MTIHTTDRKSTLALVAMTCLFSAPALGAITLAPATAVPAGGQPSGAVAADFDGDGDADLATTTDAPDRIEIKLNDSMGGFTAGPNSGLPASSSPQDLIAGDLDGDGDFDLAVCVRDPVGTVIVMMNTGAGTFVNTGGFAVGDRPRGLSIGDVDGDGDLDLAVANRNDQSVSLLLNSGTGTFSVSTMAVGGDTMDTALGDLDGDGDLDLAVSNQDGRSVEIFTFNITIGMMPSMTLSVGPFVRPDGVTAADLDGDGDVDLATATSDQTLGINQAVVWLNTGGAFGPANGYDTNGTNSSSIVAADFNCDGVLDLATANPDSSNISTLENLGGAVFAAGVTAAAGAGVDDVLAADLDGDGDPDLAVSNRDANNLSVFINDSCDAPICIGDTNGDAVINIDDIVNVVLDFGTTGDGNMDGFNGDVNASGFVDIDDIVVTVLAFGACP